MNLQNLEQNISVNHSSTEISLNEEIIESDLQVVEAIFDLSDAIVENTILSDKIYFYFSPKYFDDLNYSKQQTALKRLELKLKNFQPNYKDNELCPIIGQVDYEYSYNIEEIDPDISGSLGLIKIYNAVGVYHLGTKEFHLHKFTYDDKCPEILDSLKNKLAARLQNPKNLKKENLKPTSLFTPLPFSQETVKNFLKNVVNVKRNISCGNLFQCVLSEKFKVQKSLNKEEIKNLYMTLREKNKVPYSFYFKKGKTVIMGSSPEKFVEVSKEREVVTHPIAGTRKRGSDDLIDKKNERELKDCPKENAEHLMLVDLARNDLGKVCTPKTLEVSEFKKIKKYRYLMHIVSTVRGQLDEKKSPLDAFESCFPAGTLSGAPKHRALKTIFELEKEKRNAYGGCIFSLNFHGSMDSFIVIRSMTISDKDLVIQAGAGIVFDSVPENELEEIQTKSQAMFQVLSSGGTF